MRNSEESSLTQPASRCGERSVLPVRAWHEFFMSATRHQKHRGPVLGPVACSWFILPGFPHGRAVAKIVCVSCSSRCWRNT
jgi:hypothetical protein